MIDGNLFSAVLHSFVTSDVIRWGLVRDRTLLRRKWFHVIINDDLLEKGAGLSGSVGCAVRLETRRSRIQPPPRSATFFRGD